MAFDHFNRHRPRGGGGRRRSRLEEKVEHDLSLLQMDHDYEPDRFDYTIHRRYTPDFRVGGEHPFYIEVKGWMSPEDRQKLLAVVLSNPELPLLVAFSKPYQTISKNSKTTVAAWAARYGIAWSPIPIPKEILMSWADGKRCTALVPSATAQMQPPSTTRTGSSVSPAATNNRRGNKS